MRMQTVAQIFKVLFSSPLLAEAITVVWHAGEPLTVPIAFYERAFALQKRWNVRNIRVTNAIQTNGTLITQRWCNFFKAHHVRVGVSIDGPKHIHDVQRIAKDGEGTFEQTLAGIKLLKSNEIDYTVIAVITRLSMQYVDELWPFFVDLRPLSLGFNPEETEGINTQASLHTDEDVKAYKLFFRRILQLSYRDRTPLVIREIDAMIRHLKVLSSDLYVTSNTPLAIVSIDCDGNISTFSPELLSMQHPEGGNFIFGNVFESTLEDVLQHPRFLELNASIQHGVRRCRESCAYFQFCGGGSPSNKLFENGSFDSTETVFCRLSVKATVDALVEFLEEYYHLC